MHRFSAPAIPAFVVEPVSPARPRSVTAGNVLVADDKVESAAQPLAVAVIAPGAGTGINGRVYQELGRGPRFRVEIVGNSRTPYDRYPPNWPGGSPAPNLESFAQEVVTSRVAMRSNLLVFGSRGGQVVLPYLWAAQEQGWGDTVPPAVIINGGCAMRLPTPCIWPASAVTFLLIGGRDNFRGHFSPDDYVAETRSHVPKSNGTTAILYVNEMVHMPQANLLMAVLPLMLKALVDWTSGGRPPLERFRLILAALSRDGWSGRLLYTSSAGCWEDIKYSPVSVGRVPEAEESARPEVQQPETPPMMTSKDELKALWKAAADASRPRENARFAVVAREAARKSVTVPGTLTAGGSPTTYTGQAPPSPARALAAATAVAASGAPSLQRPALLLPIAQAGAPQIIYVDGKTPKAVESRTPKVVQVGVHRPSLRLGDPTPISRALGIVEPQSPFSPY